MLNPIEYEKVHSVITDCIFLFLFIVQNFNITKKEVDTGEFSPKQQLSIIATFIINVTEGQIGALKLYLKNVLQI